MDQILKIISEKVKPIFENNNKYFVYADEGGMFGTPSYTFKNIKIETDDNESFIGHFNFEKISKYILKRFSTWKKQGYADTMFDKIKFTVDIIDKNDFFLLFSKSTQYENFKEFFYEYSDADIYNSIKSNEINYLVGKYFNNLGIDFILYSDVNNSKEYILEKMNK